MTSPLAGLVVVVTRPAAQAARFAELVAADGATSLLLPTIEIEPITIDADARRDCTPDAFDWTIFTSANAVAGALQQLPRPTRTRIAAVGRGTARALQAAGISIDALPTTTADSEGLLALECFTDLRGQRVLVLKGRGGRTLLREELARRGAEVVACDLYERRPAPADAGALQDLQGACIGGHAVITVTSAEVLAGLLDLAPDAQFPTLRDAPLIVPGERVAKAARGFGWRGRIAIASSAEDAAMASALREASGSVSSGAGSTGAA